MATLGLICVNAASARADMCFRYSSGGGTLVAKGATLPAVNTCVPLAFFENGGLQGAATGSICTAADGSTVIFHYTYDGCLSPYFESGVCRLQLGLQIGPVIQGREGVPLTQGREGVPLTQGREGVPLTQGREARGGHFGTFGLPTIQSSCFGTYSQPGSTSPDTTAKLEYCDGPPVPTGFTCGPPLH
jgi:hypothetical protein